MKKAIYSFLVFVICQVFAQIIVSAFVSILSIEPTAETQATTLVVSSALASVATLAIFMKCGWWTFSMHYVKLRPYATLSISLLLALTLIIPCAWTQELLPESLQEDVMASVFELLLSRPEGYIIIGIIAPVIEEIVFRGAILNHLINIGETEENRLFSSHTEAKGIVVTAALFSLVHMNPAQMPHAFVIGLLLGWMYCRTKSVLPGIIYHWVNNTTAFVLAYIFPQLPYDAHLTEYFSGNNTMLIVSLIVSSTASAVLLFCFFRSTEKA